MKDLVNDPSQHVRAALAANIMGLATELGADVAVKDLLDLVMILLKDEFPDVRLNVIAKLADVSFVMGVKRCDHMDAVVRPSYSRHKPKGTWILKSPYCSNVRIFGFSLRLLGRLSDELLPAIVQLAEDRNWRVRLAIIQHIPLLAKQLGKEFFEEDVKLSRLCINWLGDMVWSIREAAIYNLKSLAEVFGTDWAKQHIVPQVCFFPPPPLPPPRSRLFLSTLLSHPPLAYTTFLPCP